MKVLLVIKENQISQVVEFCIFFNAVEDARAGLTEIIPFRCISALLGKYPGFFPSWASWGSPQGVAAVWWLGDSRYSSPSWVPFGLRITQWRAGIALMIVTCLLTSTAGNPRFLISLLQMILKFLYWTSMHTGSVQENQLQCFKSMFCWEHFHRKLCISIEYKQCMFNTYL